MVFAMLTNDEVSEARRDAFLTAPDRPRLEKLMLIQAHDPQLKYHGDWHVWEIPNADGPLPTGTAHHIASMIDHDPDYSDLRIRWSPSFNDLTPHALQPGDLALWCAGSPFGGNIKCKVIEFVWCRVGMYGLVELPSDMSDFERAEAQLYARIKITVIRRPWKRGEIQLQLARDVAPRTSVRQHRYRENIINNWHAVVDGERVEVHG